MAQQTDTPAQKVAPALRALLMVAAGLVAVAGFQLFVLSEHTERFFAWTITQPLTAATLGAAYWGSAAIVIAATRKPTWAEARIALPTVATFTTLTSVLTLLHLDRFHLAVADPITLTAGWAWFAVYVLVPPLLLIGALIQRRLPGGGVERTSPLPHWLRALLGLQGLIMLVTGLLLYLTPEQAAAWWPWPQTPLTARAIGAWAIAIGVAAIHTVWENDWRLVSAAIVSYPVVSLLALIAVARYPDALFWQGPGPWVYITFMGSVLAVGLFSMLQLRAETRSRA